jgi:hypothetical protein
VTAKRKTPTQTNGGSDDGIAYTDAVNEEIEALWKSTHAWLVNVAGSANAVTADTDAALVEPITAYARPLSFYLVPIATNTAAVTLNIDGAGPVDLRDAAANPLQGGELAAGRVYPIAFDGAQFRALTVLAGTAAAIKTAPDAVFEDQKASGTAGGSFANGAYRVRDLNTVVRNVIAGASLNAANGQFTLPAGTYWIAWRAPGALVNLHKSRLFNVTDNSVPAGGLGSVAEASNSVGSQTNSEGGVLVTITSAKAFRIEHRCQSTRNTDGFGRAASFGDTETYTRVSICKQ